MKKKMKKFTVHGTVPVVVHIDVEAENGEQAIKIATRRFEGVSQLVGNGGIDKLIGVSGTDESITVDGEPEFDDWTEH